jgi:hypothetical protein
MVDCEMGTPNNSGACLYQYLDKNDQTSAQASFAPPSVNLVLLAISTNPEPIVKTRVALPARGCGPPIPIRYCSLLI